MLIAANDEPGSPQPTPAARRLQLQTLVAALEHGADGRAGVGAILREIEALHPGAIDQAAARLQARRLGIPALADLTPLDYPDPAGTHP